MDRNLPPGGFPASAPTGDTGGEPVNLLELEDRDLGITPIGGPPKVATGPSGLASPPKSVWICMHQDPARLRITGTGVQGAGSVNVGIGGWKTYDSSPGNGNTLFPGITIGPSGKVLVAYVDIGMGQYPFPAPVTIRTLMNGSGLNSANFAQAGSFTCNLGWEEIPGNGANYVNPIPVVDWDRARNLIYVANGDKPSASGDGNDNTEIYLRRSSDMAATWSAPIKVNNNTDATSQFHPSMSVDQSIK